MSMIKVEHLTFSYPTSHDNVFEDVNFQIDTEWRLGFVGRNGRGKTTFLRLLMGNYEYSGKILSSVQFDYFPYPVADKAKMTWEILQEVRPLAREWELLRELSLLEADAGVLWRPFETLSNGEQTKVLLAALFLNEGHFLLIDEPTNHLDAHARAMVSSYLSRKKGFILVSHDRRFLDGCVDHILSLNKADICVQSGNFSSWIENFDRQQNFEQAQNTRLQKDIKRLQQGSCPLRHLVLTCGGLKDRSRRQGLCRTQVCENDETRKVLRSKTAESHRAEIRASQKHGACRSVADPAIGIPLRYPGRPDRGFCLL